MTRTRTPSTSDSENGMDRGERGQQQQRNSFPHGRRRGAPTSPRMPDVVENPEILLQMVLDINKKLWNQIKQVATFIMAELGGYEVFDRVAQWCVRNPYISLCLAACGAVTLLPVLILLGFGISTIVMTFTGFLVVEGTLLTVVSMMLFACLSALALVLIVFVIIGLALYFGFTHIYDLYGGLEGHRAAVVKFLQNEQRPGRTGSGAQSNNASPNVAVENIPR